MAIGRALCAFTHWIKSTSSSSGEVQRDVVPAIIFDCPDETSVHFAGQVNIPRHPEEHPQS
jgi:hypothetical protein